MLTAEKIHKRLDLITSILVDKGIEKPRAEIEFRNGNLSQVNLWGKDIAPSDPVSDLRCFPFGSPEEQLDEAEAYARKLPTADERNLRAFQAKLGRLIDDGRKAGIDLDFLNPLSETMKRLSENVLTHEAAE